MDTQKQTTQPQDLADLHRELRQAKEAYLTLKERLDAVESKQQLLLAEVKKYADQAVLEKLRQQINNI